MKNKGTVPTIYQERKFSERKVQCSIFKIFNLDLNPWFRSPKLLNLDKYVRSAITIPFLQVHIAEKAVSGDIQKNTR
jgi:hypothetical protein